MAKRGKEVKRSFADLEPLAHRPFAALGGLLPEQPLPLQPASGPAGEGGSAKILPAQGGNSCLIRLQKRSGGKQVTLLLHCSAACEEFLREIKRTLGVGGSCKENHLEIQGDKRQDLANFLTERGYRVRMG